MSPRKIIFIKQKLKINIKHEICTCSLRLPTIFKQKITLIKRLYIHKVNIYASKIINHHRNQLRSILYIYTIQVHTTLYINTIQSCLGLCINQIIHI